MAVRHNRTFGKRTVPHTIIIARGEAVRHFTVRPWMLALSATVGSVLAIGCLGAGAYLFMRDDLIAKASDHQARLERAYEARIQSLRSQLDLATSRQMLDRKLVQTKVDVLLGHQQELSARYDRLKPLLDRARSAGLLPTEVPTPLPRPDPQQVAVTPQPASDATLAYADGGVSLDRLERFHLIDRKAPAAIDALRASLPIAKPDGSGDGMVASTLPASDFIQSIGRSIEAAAHQQIEHLDALAEGARTKADEVASALGAAGIAVGPATKDKAGKEEEFGTGGPYEPVPSRDESFEASYRALDAALDRFQAVKTTAEKLPLDAPLPSRQVTSSFGVRPDPFLGRPALHTGIDFGSMIGNDVEATADGKVVFAGENGGYGNMVEIDHGDGFSTRYGHMSRILVTVGQAVKKGEAIGEVGSTGRSTGPHLHYEVRENGQPIDPSRFLRAGDKIRSLG